ncbi:putative fungal-specific transcription factor [Aspergillus sclerotiicarbonarius CBS 121057]|uniref:Putative fungal-specific transcription factor n=1 Tax=Aspergillus sclerotiicarbonarius (strain CBS 121057 / IBT 28362) TaxID=1448318 RepID=A0A319EKN6_ASPSB|nr:putative fungal-specific transcription factor [Aspergillus sclerotiicarbonarius CBS 121057]
METPGRESRHPRAAQVCRSCKLRKRKCDKALPKCSSCARKQIVCEYVENVRSKPHSPVASSDRWWETSPVNQVLDFPTLLFLDPALLRHGQVETGRVAAPLSSQILQLLGDADDIRKTAYQFFDHVHQWMPFISKKRFEGLDLPSSFQSRPDIALLLLGLKLITTFPPVGLQTTRTPLYHATKHFYLEVEGSSVFSISVLQAGVLIALYELGHGIYPAAFLSVGACARYAHALGIGAGPTVQTSRVLTMVEVEERKRVWWAIVILDRFVSIGCPGRLFTTADPRLDDLLPANDAAWDQGILGPDDCSPLSSPMTRHMSKFALLCQAARLLGQVLRHVSNESVVLDDSWMQLDRTLQSMLAACLDVDSPDYDQITFVYSTLVALHAPWFSSDCSNAVNAERIRCARSVLEKVTDRIGANLVERQCFLGRDPADLSPWGLFFAYQICGAHMRAPERSAPLLEVVRCLKEGLLAINVRWKAAGVYLQLLEAQEAIRFS